MHACPGGPSGNVEGSGLVKTEALWLSDDLGRVDDDVVGLRVHARTAEHYDIRVKCGYSGAHLVNDAREIVAVSAGRLGVVIRRRWAAMKDFPVDRVEAGGLHPHPHFTRPRLWGLLLSDDVQDLWAPEFFEPYVACHAVQPRHSRAMPRP